MKLFSCLSILALSLSCATADGAARDADLASTALKRELTVGVVVLPGAFDSELAAAIDVFHRTAKHAHPPMQVFTVGAMRDSVQTSAGLSVTPDWSFASAPAIDVLVVPSTEHGTTSDLELPEYVEFVRSRGRTARFVLSSGNGPFVMAQAGLLRGHRSAVSPAAVERMHELFPHLRLAVNEPYAHDGSLITSPGGMRAYDASLYVVELVYGETTADAIAEDLAIDRRSPTTARAARRE